MRLLNQSQRTVTSIKAMLNEDRLELLSRLDRFEDLLLMLASSIEGVGGLAAAVRPDLRLSNQALRILREFGQSGAGKAVDLATFDGRCLMLTQGGSGQIEFDEPRFVDDDLNLLVESGLLRLEYDSQGRVVFIFTRMAVEFLEAVGPGNSP